MSHENMLIAMYLIYVIKEWNFINFVNMNKARTNQAASQLSKTQFFPMTIVNQ